MRVTKEDVIRAASDLADQQGLNGVSLKSVAEQLGLRAPSPVSYTHLLPGGRVPPCRYGGACRGE